MINGMLYHTPEDFGSGIPIFNGLTLTILFMCAIVYLALIASTTFSAYSSKHSRLTTLCLPVGNSAKYIVNIINGAIYPIIAFVVSAFLSIVLSLMILQLIFTIHFDGAIDFISLLNLSYIPDVTYSNFILFILLVQAFFVAGSIFYPSKSFIKTLGLGAGLFFGSAGLSTLVFLFYFDKGYILSTDAIEQWYQCLAPALIVGFYAVSYFRMKSIQTVLRW